MVASQLLSKIRLGNKKKFDIFKKICYNIYVIKIVKKTVTAIIVNALGAVCRGFDSHILPQYGGISSVGRATIKTMLSCRYSHLAQQVEQLAVNQRVVGSSPAVGARCVGYDIYTE